VQTGETLFCIGRAYGVLPMAIAFANELNPNATLRPGARLSIPAARWTNIPSGAVCPAQFQSPFPGLPTATATAAPSATATATFTSVPVVVNTATNTLPAPTATATSTPVDITPPTITNLNANPTTISLTVNCTVTYTADIADASGVSTAVVDWNNSAQQSGTQGMALISGSSVAGTWRAVFAAPIPYFGSLDWTVTAFDVAGNQTTSGGGPTIRTTSMVCP
jgi:hypothetical protein